MSPLLMVILLPCESNRAKLFGSVTSVEFMSSEKVTLIWTLPSVVRTPSPGSTATTQGRVIGVMRSSRGSTSSRARRADRRGRGRDCLVCRRSQRRKVSNIFGVFLVRGSGWCRQGGGEGRAIHFRVPAGRRRRRGDAFARASSSR